MELAKEKPTGKRGRLALTLMTLILGGAIFIAVFSVRASLLGTLDNWLDYFQFDVDVQFSRVYRVERIRRETLKVPGVVEVEPCLPYQQASQRHRRAAVPKCPARLYFFHRWGRDLAGSRDLLVGSG